MGTDPAALAAAVAQMRHNVAAGGDADLATLKALAAAVPHHTRAAGASDMALLGLLDEVDLLIGEFGRQQAAASNQLRALTRHHQAGSAYGGRNGAP